MTFPALSPDKMVGIPSMHERTRIIGVSRTTLKCIQKHVMEKRCQLTAGEKGVYWALAKRRRDIARLTKIFDLC